MIRRTNPFSMGSDKLGGRGASTGITGVGRSTSIGGPGVAPAPAAGYVAPTASPPALPPHAGAVSLPQAQHPYPQLPLPQHPTGSATPNGEAPQPQHPYPHSYYPPGPHYNYPAAPGQVAKPEDPHPPPLPSQPQPTQPQQPVVPAAVPQSGGRLIEQLLQQQQQPPSQPSHPQLPAPTHLQQTPQPNPPPQPKQSPQASPPQPSPQPQPSPPQPPPTPTAAPAKKGPHYEKEAGAILFHFSKNKDSEEDKAEDVVNTQSPKTDGDESYPIDYAIGIALRFHILVPLFQNSVSSSPEGSNDLVDVAKFCGRYCRGDTVYVTKEGTDGDGDGDANVDVACRIEQCTLKDATLFEAWYQHDKHLPHTSATWNQWWKTQCGNPDPNCEMVKLISPKPPRTADQGVNLDAADDEEEKELVLGVAYYERSIVDSIPLLPKESDDGTKRIVATSLLRGMRLNPLYNPELQARYTDVEPPAHTHKRTRVYRGIEKCLFSAVLFKSLYYNTKTMAVNSRKSCSRELFWKEQCNMSFITVDSHDEDGRRYYRLTGNDRWEYLRTEFKKQWTVHETVLKTKTKAAAAIVVKDEVLPPTTTTIAKSPVGSPKVEAISTQAEPNGTAADATTATSVIGSTDAAEQTKSLTPSTAPAFTVEIAKDDPMDMDIVPNDANQPNDPKAPAPSPDDPASPKDPTNNPTSTVDTAVEGSKRIRDTDQTSAATPSSTAADTGAVADPEPPCKKVKTESATATNIAAIAAANAAAAIHNTTEAPKPEAAGSPKQLSETASAPIPGTADATTNPDKPAATVPQSLPITPIKKEDKHTEVVEDMNATVFAL